MPFSTLDLLLAWLLDAVLGDPPQLPWPHPVVAVGRLISSLECRVRGAATSAAALVLRGAALWVAVVGGTVAAGWLLLAATGALHPVLGHAAGVYLAYACLATRDLADEAADIAGTLRRGSLPGARRRLARIVGRDTTAMDATAVARSGIESVAENSSDGVVAPLFYLALGGVLGWGPLLGLAYKAVNTLDSMLGYHTPRHEHLGKVSARLDDLANWVPARLTALLVAAAYGLRGGRAGRLLAVVRRDGSKHSSPNSGYPEAAFAAALGVQLGGGASYGGVHRPAPLLGDPGPAPRATHLRRAVHLLWWISALGGMLAGATLSLF
ncbi:MAG: adenosylcobinamide-phosphate synthase CbiB [Deferrisomatales bacterium]|nr:adenosylcobinamide-phosphate synthase CbiB [Deferrisomatales bacterium]